MSEWLMTMDSRNATRFKTTIVAVLFTLLALSLAGCNPADVQDLKNAASDSATLAAIITRHSLRQPAQVRDSNQEAHRSTEEQRADANSGKRVKNTPGDFDFYVLSLSWSPDYCAGSNVNDPQQCSLGKKLAFVLHGLWPQYTRGYPADCSTAKLPKDAQQKFPNLYPSPKLYTHEWNKHGTCSGLKPEEYLTLSKTLKESLVIPATYRSPAKAFRTTTDQLKADFVSANPTASADALAVQCSGSGRYLQELRICFSREGQPIACSKEVQNDAAKSCGRMRIFWCEM